MKPKEVATLYRWTFELQQLRFRVKARSFSDADWLLLDKLLTRIAAGEDVRGYFHGHAVQEKAAAKKSANDAERRLADMEKLVAAAYKLGNERSIPPLPKIAKAAGVKVNRARDLTTKRELWAIVSKME